MRAALNDVVIRYGKHIPGLGTGYGLLEEFVKDGRNWPGGMEHQKDRVTAILNRCPECWNAFAGEAYDILRRGKAGEKLSADETVFYNSLSKMVDLGKFLSADASYRSLIERANPNDVVTWRSKNDVRAAGKGTDIDSISAYIAERM